MKQQFTPLARPPFRLSPAFYRVTMPLLTAAAVLSGCSTTSALHTELDSCMEKTYTAYKSLSTNNQFASSSMEHGYNPHCSAAQRMVRLGMVKDPETGNYSVLGLRTLRLIVQDPKLDPRTLAQIQLRLKMEHGIATGDLLKLEQAQWRKDNGIGPTVFKCRTIDGVRRCRDEPATPPERDDPAVPPVPAASAASSPAQ